MGYDPAGELTSEEETYKALFDDSKKAIDDEVEQNFQRLQKERRRRVAEAVQTAGVDEEQIADEFGVVAPMPVTSFAADPYARQHGIGVEGSKQVSDLQKAMLESSDHQTMEIKLNVLNDTVELQRVGQQAPVSDEAINRVLESDAPLEPVEQLPPQEAPAEIPAPVETPARQRPRSLWRNSRLRKNPLWRSPSGCTSPKNNPRKPPRHRIPSRWSSSFPLKTWPPRRLPPRRSPLPKPLWKSPTRQRHPRPSRRLFRKHLPRLPLWWKPPPRPCLFPRCPPHRLPHSPL